MTTLTITEHDSECIAVPASRYTFDELAEIYNRARVDYIVPMPMNAKRMEEYVHCYDIDLNASALALDSAGQEIGVIMLGVRGDRTWVTRLGVLPECRGHKVGQFLMELLINHSRTIGARLVQLEVIRGNTPAINLFTKLRFQPTRDLLVIRRPPGPLTPPHEPGTITALSENALPDYLTRRELVVSWIEETPSLLNAGNLHGLTVALPSGESGWVVYQKTAFQLTHFVLCPEAAGSPALAHALIYHVHQENSRHDTKIENLPRDHPTWPAFQQAGYIESFSRIEMVLNL